METARALLDALQAIGAVSIGVSITDLLGSLLPGDDFGQIAIARAMERANLVQIST